MLAVRNINRPRSYPRNPSRNGVASCVIIPRKEEKKIVSFRSTLVHACNSFLPARGIDYFPFSRFEPLIVDALVPCGSSKVGSSRTASSIHRSGSINCSRIFLSAPMNALEKLEISCCHSSMLIYRCLRLLYLII